MTGSESGPVTWRKSSASAQGSNECVEVAFVDDSVLVRHSRNSSGPMLSFTHSEWRAFLTGTHNGEFDLPGA